MVGAAVVGAALAVCDGDGGAVVARTVGGGELGDADALALALALGEDDAVLGAMRAPPRRPGR